MTTIYDAPRDHLGVAHRETIEVNEETLMLYHTWTHPDGSKTHEMERTLTPKELAQYLSDIPKIEALGLKPKEETIEA